MLKLLRNCIHHHIHLRASFCSDLEWWAMFLSDWNRVSMMTSLGRVVEDLGDPQPDWTSIRWRLRFSTIYRKD